MERLSTGGMVAVLRAAPLRLREERLTGTIALVAVAALVTASIALGLALPSTVPHLLNGGAWLADKASLVHVNGTVGKVDGRVQLGLGSDPLDVEQHGSTVLVRDRRTGAVSSIDAAQLDVHQTQAFGPALTQVVTGAGVSYVVDALKGTVQRVDPTQLSTIGSAVRLAPPLGMAALDGRGVLWVAVPARGQVAPIRAGKLATPVRVGDPADDILLTAADGTPVVTDATAGTTAVVTMSGIQLRVNLPSAIAPAAAGSVAVPAATEGPLVPVLATASTDLALIDTTTGSYNTVSLGLAGDQLGNPQVLGHRVYVPDNTTGNVVVYDSAAGEFDRQIPVAKPQAGLQMTAFVQDGQLWINDDNAPSAVVVGSDGGVQVIGKEDNNAPAGKPSSTPTPVLVPTVQPGPPTAVASPAPAPAPAPAPKPTSTPTAAPTPTPRPSATPTPVPLPPQAPGTITATAGAGWMDVSFSPSGGGTPTGYQLLPSSPVGAVTPASVPPGGPFTFHVTGAACSSQYTFKVAALYSGGQVPSAASVPVRPCIPPGSPQGLNIGVFNHGANLAWSAPASLGGASSVTYTVSWSGAVSGSAPAGGTSLQVTGLRNGGGYQLRVTATNPAGAGTPASASSPALVGPQYGAHNTNSGLDLRVRRDPSINNPPAYDIPAGVVINFTVLCQVNGQWIQDRGNAPEHGSVWDQVVGPRWSGVAYISDLYVSTPNSNSYMAGPGSAPNYSYPPIWECT